MLFMLQFKSIFEINVSCLSHLDSVIKRQKRCVIAPCDMWQISVSFGNIRSETTNIELIFGSWKK